MKVRWRRAARWLAGGLVVAAAMASASSGLAQPTAPAAATAVSPADPLAVALYDSFYTPKQVDELAGAFTGAMPSDWPPPWSALLAAAVSDEAQADRDAIVARITPVVAGKFSDAELAVGVRYLHERAASPTNAAAPNDPVVAELMSTDPGRSFAQKFRTLGPALDAALQPAMSYWVPGVFRRFGEKVQVADKAPPADAADQMRADIACGLLPAEAMRQSIKTSIQQALAGLVTAFTDHPEWGGAMSQAAADEIDATHPQFCSIVGGWVGKGLTLQELQATASFLKTPPGATFMRMTSGALKGDQVPVRERPPIERFLASSAGGKLMTNMDPHGDNGGDAGKAYAQMIMPGVFRRFGEAASTAPSTPAH